MEFYVDNSKTYQLSQGFIFHVTGNKFNGISIPKILNWYLKSTELTGDDYLFPRFRNHRGRVVAQGDYSISYSSSASQLRQFCIKNRIPPLTLHSGRRGGVTAAVEAGISKMEIQAVGNWSSDCVNNYFCPKRAGLSFTSRLIKDL